jgi:hypothetical protein
MDLARIAIGLCSFLQMLREKYVSETAVQAPTGAQLTLDLSGESQDFPLTL